MSDPFCSTLAKLARVEVCRLTKVADGHEHVAGEGDAGGCVAGGQLAGHVVEAVGGDDDEHGGHGEEANQGDTDLRIASNPSNFEALPKMLRKCMREVL